MASGCDLRCAVVVAHAR